MNRHIQKLSITLISLTMVLSGCGKADPDNHSWVIDNQAIENAIPLNSLIVSHERDLVVRLEAEGVTFNSSFTKDAILIRDMGLELPKKDVKDKILSYEDIKAVSLSDYSANVVSSGSAIEITIPKAFKKSSFGAIIAPYATDKRVMAYASFSGSESVITLSEGKFEQIGADYVGGYDYNHTFVFKYESLTLSEDFDVEDISLLGAFENWIVKDIHTDTEGVIILETTGYPVSKESGAIVFDNSTFVENRGGAFSYRVLYPSAALVENSVRFNEDDKTFSFDVVLIDCEIKKDFSLKDLTLIDGFTINEAHYVAETKTASYVLDAEEYNSLTEVIAELEQLTISIGGEFNQEVAFDFHEPEVFAIASNENKKVSIDLYSFDGELTSLDKSALTIDAEFIADVDEEELLPIDEATLTKVGKGYRLTWEKEIDYPVYGTLTIDSVDVSYPNGNKFTVVGSSIEFGCDYYQVDSEENRLMRPVVFRYVTPTSLAGMDDTFVRYAYDASLEDKATAISAANTAVQTVLTVLTVAFELAASELSKLACGGIIGVLLGALGLAGVTAALDPTAAMLQQILNVVSGINETVKRMEKTLSEVSYKTDMVLLRERLNSDENKLIALRARQLEFQSEDAKVTQYEKKILTVANRYLTSIFDGNTNKKSNKYKAPYDYNVVIVEGKNKKGELEKTSTILLDDDSFNETFDEGTIVSSYAFSFGSKDNLKNTFKDNTLPKYKNKKTVDKVVGEAALSDIKDAIKNNLITFSTNEWSGSQIPDVSDDAKLEAVAKDIYRALYLFAEREALCDVDGESFVLQAVDYMQRFSGTGSYSRPAADIDYEMLKLTYGFQSEAEDKIHNYRITTADRLLKIYNLATTICAIDPDISSYGDLTKAYKASIAYLNKNKMVKGEAEKRAVIERSKLSFTDAKLDYCYVSESWVRGGQIMTGFKATSDKNKEGKWQNFEIADVSGEIRGKLQSNMNNVTPMSSVKPYLFGLEDMRVLLIRKQQNFPSYSNFNYLKDKLGLIRNYMIDNNNINKREFTNEDDITKAICATNRFVYAYTGFKELGTHTEGEFFAYCSRSFTKENDNDKNPDYFSLNEKIWGFPTSSKRELKYYRGWGLKGEFSDIENIMNVTASGYMNRFVNYNEDHGAWRNPENWGFSEFNSVGNLSHPSFVESIQFYYCLIRMY